MAQAPGANRSENADAEGQEGAGAHAFKQIMNTTIDSDELILKHAPRKHTMRYLLGLLLLIAPAMGLLIAPIYRAMLSVTYAVTMNFINSRRYLAQAVLMLAYEVIWFDAASWLPYEPLTYYRDRLDQLVLLHAKAVMGIDCIATATIAQLSQFTLYDAPCQPACGNLTMGLDRQIEWFITKANTFYDTAVNNTVSFTNANLNTMYQLVPSIVDNVNTMDIMFENLITNSNSDAKLAMIVLFVAILLITIGVYFICLRATALHRLQEMDSAVTLLFGIPDTVMTQVPEIKRFIDSGGMFADDGGIRKKSSRSK
ncbi:hypothetical protein DFS34DRAFT_639958 [Phlyctochytrium arcticum]|nr:hypothetical protein DFS34DRAFT_639958 [Phlyctochytrium arcticum]